MINSVKHAGALALSFSLLLSGCTFISEIDPFGSVTVVRPSGKTETETRPVSGISGVALHGTGTVEIEQGARESLEISADDNVLPLIESKVTNGILEFRFKRNVRMRGVPAITYRVKVKSLNSIGLSGAGAIKSSTIDTESLEVNLSGAGEITLAGRAKVQRAELSGTGALIMRDLVGETGDVSISGAAMCEVNVTSALRAQISGVGEIKHRGSPRITQKISGAGSISELTP